MTNLDLAYTSATELVHLIREKQISPVEIIQNSLERIQSVNSRLNCFCFTYPEEALQKAHAAEQDITNFSLQPSCELRRFNTSPRSG